MIVKISMLILLLSINLLKPTSGTSYSQVYVESEVVPVPVDFYQYGNPYTQVVSPQLARLNTVPARSSYPPCGSPCIISGQTFAPAAPLNPNTNVITYNAPIPNTVPVLISPNNKDKSGYEYSYVVYDDSTGDHKAQREHSDGAVVRGEYSFLQPDGYVREVQYIADDIQGFNAVVKNFLPISGDSQKKDEHKAEESSPNCPEVKHESLKVAPQETLESTEDIKVKTEPKETTESKDSGSKQESNETSANNSKEGEDNSKENKGSQESSDASTANPTNNSKVTKDSSKSSGSQESGEYKEKSKEELKEKPENKSNEESSAESKEKQKDKTNIDTKESTSESGEEIKAILIPQGVPQSEKLVPYNDIIRCIQAAIDRSEKPAQMKEAPSALTYIILNKPC